jgi:hypothetical protein
MLCTGYRGIEFVARTAIDIPQKSIRLGGIHLWKCGDAPKDKDFVYDGWFPLGSVSSDSIAQGLNAIELGINLLAFTYGAESTWRVKYDFMNSSKGYPTPTEEDLSLLGEIISKYPFEKGDEASVLAVAIDWHNRGRSSANKFTAFLCYYIAIELVIHEVMDSDSLFGIAPPNTREDRTQEKIRGINSLHERMYEIDPIEFINRAYFDCVLSIKAQSKHVLGRVFGDKHPNYAAMFEKGKEGLSLLDLRGRLAHGRMHPTVPEDKATIERRLPEMAIISREFLMRLSLSLAPTQEVPSWGGMHRLSLSMDDPRSTLIMTGEKSGLPPTDWKIRPEWCS